MTAPVLYENSAHHPIPTTTPAKAWMSLQYTGDAYHPGAEQRHRVVIRAATTAVTRISHLPPSPLIGTPPPTRPTHPCRHAASR